MDTGHSSIQLLTRVYFIYLLFPIYINTLHDVSEAVSLADRVILIENGKIALDIKITLPRPRIRDAGFAHFEQVILDRVLTPDHRAEARSAASLYDI
ncbi:ABC-type multidrug transport system ATPase subunit [Fontibacillus solani]|uniref:ABC-type multidrug transport system ATPase subunit n=1 Tax=Fontibacillus solani TaxID=1572857 RepID=A0A7W3SPK2_9BACL|nr:ABC-type multidrug transport system ATPase subunit [Fontibacillus solani]